MLPVSVCTSVLSALKGELMLILRVTLTLVRSLAALGPSSSRDTSAVLSLTDIQDKDDTQQRKAKCLLKIRQHLRRFISFITRPTSINPHSETIGATVQEGSSDG